MSDSNETLDPQKELPLNKDNIVEMIGQMDEVQSSRQIWDTIAEIQRGAMTGEGSDFMNAAAALVHSRELRLKLLSSENLLEFDALIRKARDKLNELTMKSDLQSKVWTIVQDSIEKESNE